MLLSAAGCLVLGAGYCWLLLATWYWVLLAWYWVLLGAWCWVLLAVGQATSSCRRSLASGAAGSRCSDLVDVADGSDEEVFARAAQGAIEGQVAAPLWQHRSTQAPISVA